ncbi:MAG: hypothetical protein M1828_005386 [Chrysothrix sp. TS-e1954]|nr:MAG: hypothetical protein M1828_005386 [Chrysothrix sp. TS-e1954]
MSSEQQQMSDAAPAEPSMANPSFSATKRRADPTANADPTMSTSEANVQVANDPVPSSAVAGTPAAEGQPVLLDGVAATGENSGETVVAPDVNGAAGTPSSNKKSHKKKGGVPEHKKGKRKKSAPELHLDCEPGKYYWAQMRGFPKWPAIICDEEILPESLLFSRPVSTKRPDGTYREDFETGGKNVRDRTYPIMYLHTNEFSWTPNTDLKPLDTSQLDVTATVAKNKKLVAAYELAREQPPLTHFKHVVANHVLETQKLEKEALEEAAKEAEADEKKAKKKEDKEKRKSITKTPKPKKAAADEMEVDPEDESAKKSSKKRKADATDGENSAKKAKTGTGQKLSLKQTATPKTKKPKTQAAAATAAAAEPDAGLTEAELRQKLEKETLFFRHKLQKTFLTRDTPPSDEEMTQADDFLTKLERHEHLDDAVIRVTKIHKVLRGILTAKFSIPHDEEMKFSERCRRTLEKWGYPFDAPKTPAVGAASKDEKTSNGETAVGKTDKTEETEKVEKVEQPEDAGNGEDTAMPDASADPAKHVETGTEIKTDGDVEMKEDATPVEPAMGETVITNGDAPADATQAQPGEMVTES